MNVSDLDLVALAQALDDHEPDREHYVDLEGGSLWTFVYSETTDEARARHEEVRADLERPEGERRWARIPSMTTQQAFEEIEDFVEDVASEAAQDELFALLEKRRAIRNFREALMQLPDVRQQWSAFRRERSRARLDAFLDRLGLRHPDAAVTTGATPDA